MYYLWHDSKDTCIHLWHYRMSKNIKVSGNGKGTIDDHPNEVSYNVQIREGSLRGALITGSTTRILLLWQR